MTTPITYYGGKQTLASTIISMMPVHKIYCEPYFGGGAVFFAKGPSEVEVINDHDSRLMTFYRCILDSFDELQQIVQNTLHSEEEWKRAKKIFFDNHHRYSDLETAWSVWVMCNMSYSCSPTCGWKWDNAGSTSASLYVKRQNFTDALCKRLKLVQISSRDAITVIQQRDSPDTFFYLDPPYLGCQQQHYRGFKTEDLIELLTTLSKIQGRFILSHFMNRQLQHAIKLNNWQYKVIDKPLTVANNVRATHRRKQELLVYNYVIEPSLFD